MHGTGMKSTLFAFFSDRSQSDVENDRHRAVVDELEPHVGAEQVGR